MGGRCGIRLPGTAEGVGRGVLRPGGNTGGGGLALAGLFSILRALGRVVYRDLQKLGSLTGTLFSVRSGCWGRARVLQLVLGLRLLFPFTSHPPRKIPAERLQGWPLGRGEKAALRAASVFFSPVAWITVGLLIWGSSVEFAAAFLGGRRSSTRPVLVWGAPGRAPPESIPLYAGVPWGHRRPGAKGCAGAFTVLDAHLAVVLSRQGFGTGCGRGLWNWRPRSCRRC